MRKNFNGSAEDRSANLSASWKNCAPSCRSRRRASAKPTLDQYDYDETRFSEAYDKWMEQKDEAEPCRSRSSTHSARSRRPSKLQEVLRARKESLGVEDFDEAEAEVGSHLNQTQAGLLMRGADDPAVLVYALSKSPARLMDLAKITDPVKFTVAVAKMEISLATKKTSRPAPEARITPERALRFQLAKRRSKSSARRLRRTGDFTEVAKYKRENGIK
jgi:hypothetical protein